MPSINSLLNDMRRAGKVQDMKAKGNYGEDAVIAICSDRKTRQGHGLLYQGFMYPYASNRDGVVYAGNIVYNTETEKFTEYSNKSINDEIDVLYVTPYRIFAIEVKSYHAKLIIDKNGWLYRSGQPVDKSPIAQAEKHARHLYQSIYEVIPDGDWHYIVPIVCFVDQCKVSDDRHPVFVNYIPVCILNNLLNCINKYNKPLDYNLDLNEIAKKLNSIKVSAKEF